MIPFSSERKAMGIVVRLQSIRYRLFPKGASEILTKKCTRYVIVSAGRQPGFSHSLFGPRVISNLWFMSGI